MHSDKKTIKWDPDKQRRRQKEKAHTATKLPGNYM